MTLEEAFTKFAATRSHGLPWEIGADDLRAIFTAGWHAHYEAGRQTDMFPGTLTANVAQSAEQLFCKQSVVGSIPSVGSNSLPSVTADDIYAAYPRKVNPKGAKKAIQKAFGPGALDRPEYILAKTKEFAAATKSWPEAERKFIPHPQTWFNAGGWMTDPKEWVRGAAAVPSQFSRQYD